MPDYFSHLICAQKILEKCGKAERSLIADRYLYLLGAQGGDVFFAYKLNLKDSNLGRRIHGMNALDLFEILQYENPSYAAGFATHYALDCTLHPIIYRYENSVKTPLAHIKFENDLGLYISRKYSIPRKILPRERVLGCTFAVYDCISKIEPQLTVTGTERCLKRHFSYTRALFRSKKQVYACDYGFASLSDAVSESVSFGAECVSAVLGKSVSKELFSRSFLER